MTEISFSANQLTTMILNNAQLRKHFSSNAVELFSSIEYSKVKINLTQTNIFSRSFVLNKFLL